MNSFGTGSLVWSKPERPKAVRCPGVKDWWQKTVLIGLLRSVKTWIESGVKGAGGGKVAI